MKVFLSNVPGFILAKELQGNSFKKWVYFGTNDRVLKKLKRIFPDRAQQINYGEELYRITRTKRNQYIRWIDRVASHFPNNKEWLFSVSSVKNTYTSNLFLYICYIFLLEGFIKEGKRADLVFVDSPALTTIFKDSFPGTIKVMPINRWLKLGFYFKIVTKSVLRFGKYLIEFSRKYVSAKVVLKKSQQAIVERQKKSYSH